MKKGLILAGCCLFLLTGCGKKVTCTYKDKDYAGTITSKVDMYYNSKNKVKRIEISEQIKIADEYKDKFDDFLDEIKDKIGEPKKYYSSHIKTSKNTISLREEYLFNKMDSEDIIDAGFYSAYDSDDEVIYLKDLIEYYEDSDYVCK